MSERNRCRILLIVDCNLADADALVEACSRSDVASVILASLTNDNLQLAEFARRVTEPLQDAGVAVLIHEDSQIMGRVSADGLYTEQPAAEIGDAVARFSPHKIVGCGNLKDRHRAMQAGEAKPDFVLFGRPGGDIRPEPHPKNLALAQWWSEIIELPCVVAAGSAIEGVVMCAQSGAEFVALGVAITGKAEVAQLIEQANELLDLHAPDLVEADD